MQYVSPARSVQQQPLVSGNEAVKKRLMDWLALCVFINSRFVFLWAIIGSAAGWMTRWDDATRLIRLWCWMRWSMRDIDGGRERWAEREFAKLDVVVDVCFGLLVVLV